MLNRLKWKNLNIGWKYGVALSITILLFIISTAVVSVQLSNVSSDIEAMDRRAERSVLITDMMSEFRSKDTRIADYMISVEQTYLDEYQSRRDTFNILQDTIAPRMDTEEQENLFAQIQANDQETNRLFMEEMVPAVGREDKTTAANIRNDIRDLRSETISLLEELRTTVDNERNIAIQDAKNQSTITFWTLIGSIALSIILGVLAVLLINRGIQRNLQNVVDMSNQVANGNLSVEKITSIGNDEIGRLSKSFNVMSDNLRQMVKQIQDISENVSSQSEELTQSSYEVSTGSQQIASTMEQLSSVAEEQATSSSEISKVMEDLNKQIRESNEEGERLKESSQDVRKISGDGKEQMDHSVEHMAEIATLVTDSVEKVKGLDQRSEEVTKLVDVIESISQQTNLLALNAAIEAARAGESGKGFAVVADEVRKLAEQVGASVIEITDIIEGIQKETKAVVVSLESGHEKVEEGNRQIHTSRDYFDDINDSISDMIVRIENVSNNLTDITAKSDQISVSVQGIASSSQEASAGVEETSSTAQQQSSSMQEVSGSAESLSQLSEELNDLIKRFKI